QMLASTPASILNHKTPRTGIPPDSDKQGNALEHFPFRSKRSERKGIAQAIESGAISYRSGVTT
ncbi:hypothetical protein, partial [Amorphus sp. MBR-141]